jgi:uncharacterized protein YeaO (DUF488 family)
MAERAKVDVWIKEVAPSTQLRMWYGHDPKKWVEFKRRFFSELHRRQDLVEGIVNASRKGTVTLLFGSKEERFNNAVAFKEFVEARMNASERKKTA